MIVSINEFWEFLTNLRMDLFNAIPRVKLASVIELTRDGEPIIQFMADSLPSQKIYIRLKHYIPEIGDRVMLISDIIIGGWKP